MKTWGKMRARGRRLRLSAGRGCIRKPVAARGFVSGRGPKTDRTAGRNLFLDSRRAGFGRDEAKRKVCGTIPLARHCLRPSIAQSHFVHEKGGFSWMKLGRAMVYRKRSEPAGRTLERGPANTAQKRIIFPSLWLRPRQRPFQPRSCR